MGHIRVSVRRGVWLTLVMLAACVLAFGQAPAIFPGGTGNAADYSRNFAPGGWIAIFGTNLASANQQAGAYPLPTSLAGTSVELVSTGAAIPLWFVSPGQIDAQLPYDVPVGQVQLRIRNSAGASNTDTITVSKRAPRIFTLDFSGKGAATATSTDFKVLTASNATDPAETIILWMNSMGEVDGNVVAGQPAPGLTPGEHASKVTDTVTATINGVDAHVSFAGLSPGSAGLYQVNLSAPFLVLTGPLNIQVTVGNDSTQASVTVPYRQLGFYFSVLGGKSVSGQTLNGVAGANSALAFRHSDVITWGSTGLNAWTKNTGLGSAFSSASGLAMTLRNGAATVYDNNGIEDGTFGNFYNNTGGVDNSQKPGLADMFSMSNYFPLVFTGYFKLSQAATVTELIGYFDRIGQPDAPFDPENPFVRYRMNIWSNANGTPKEMTDLATQFRGDVFSSDTTAGTFSVSDTGVRLISNDPKAAPKPIYRVSYKLTTPLNLPAGEYWLGHDASVRAQPAASSTAQSITVNELHRYITMQKLPATEPMRFSFFGRELTFEDSWVLPEAVVVRPTAPIMY